MLFHGKDDFLCLQAFLSWPWFFLYWKFHELLPAPFHITVSVGVILCSSCVRSHDVRLHRYSLIYLGDTISQQTSFPFLRILRSFWSLFWNDPWASGRAVVLWVHQFGLGSTTQCLIGQQAPVTDLSPIHQCWSSMHHCICLSYESWNPNTVYHTCEAGILWRLHLPPHTVKEFSPKTYEICFLLGFLCKWFSENCVRNQAQRVWVFSRRSVVE